MLELLNVSNGHLCNESVTGIFTHACEISEKEQIALTMTNYV